MGAAGLCALCEQRKVRDKAGPQVRLLSRRHRRRGDPQGHLEEVRGGALLVERVGHVQGPHLLQEGTRPAGCLLVLPRLQEGVQEGVQEVEQWKHLGSLTFSSECGAVLRSQEVLLC